jgi:hypothetical protein
VHQLESGLRSLQRALGLPATGQEGEEERAAVRRGSCISGVGEVGGRKAVVDPLSVEFLASLRGQEAQAGCRAREVCVHYSLCPAWPLGRRQLDRLTQGTRAYESQVARLQSKICNKREKHVCCEGAWRSP